MKRVLSISNSKSFIHTVIFLFIVVILFFLMSIFIHEEEKAAKRWDVIYSNNDLDIVFFGNSHANKTFRADYLTNIGINSTIIGGSSETFMSTYYNVKEVIRVQDPSIIVIELNSIFREPDLENERLISYNIDNLYGMKLSTNRLLATYNVIDSGSYVEALFPLIRYHDEWKGIANWNENYRYNTRELDIFRGYMYLEHVIDQELWSQSIVENRRGYFEENERSRQTIPQSNIEMLNTLIEECASREIDLYFVKSPILSDDWMTMSKSLVELENELDIKVIDYNLLWDTMDFMYQDFYDESHLSQSGAYKITIHFLEQYINKNEKFQLDYTYYRNKSDVAYKYIVKKADDNYTFKVFSFNNDAEYAFQIYKDGSKYMLIDYSNNNEYELKLTETGVYKVKYYVVANHNSKEEDKTSGYFDEIIDFDESDYIMDLNIEENLDIAILDEIVVDELLIHKNGEKYTFKVESRNKNVEYAFYIYNNGERIIAKSYSDEDFIDVELTEVGMYKVKYFIVNSSIDNKFNDGLGNGKVSGYFEDTIIN